MYLIKLNFKKSLLLSLCIFVLGCHADDSTSLKNIRNTLEVEHDFTIYQRILGADKPKYDGLNDPIIFIQAITPIKCEDPGTGNTYKESISSCTMVKPLPQTLTLRYGKWLSRSEAEKQFPEPYNDNDYREKMPKVKDYKTIEEWDKANDSYWQQIKQLPQFKAYKEAKHKSIENIEWHTITIHPQEIMNKYKGKIPYEDVKSFPRISPYLRSTNLILYITVNPDMSVTLKEDYQFKQPGKPSYH